MAITFMDPLPSKNKAFALTSPEEVQRKITSQVGCTSDSVGSMTFTVKSYNAKRLGIPNFGNYSNGSNRNNSNNGGYKG